MYLRFENGVDIWVPLYILNQGGKGDVIYWTFKATETFLYFPTLVMVVLFSWSLLKVRLAHPNLTYIAMYQLLTWFECFVAACCLFPFQESLVDVSGTRLLAPTNQIDDVVLSPNLRDSLLIIVGGALRLHYGYSVCNTTALIMLERTVATLLFRDYEQHSRTYIAIGVIFVSNAYAFPMTILSLFGALPYSLVLGIPTTIAALSIFGYAFLNWYNLRTQRLLDKRYRSFAYTLGARFQAKENLRVLKLVRNVYLGVIALVLTNGILIAGVIFGYIEDNFKNVVFSTSHSILYLGPMFVMGTVVRTMPEWWNATIAVLPRGRICPRKRLVEDSRPSECKVKPIEEADMYWKQFNQQW